MFLETVKGLFNAMSRERQSVYRCNGGMGSVTEDVLELLVQGYHFGSERTSRENKAKYFHGL